MGTHCRRRGSRRGTRDLAGADAAADADACRAVSGLSTTARWTAPRASATAEAELAARADRRDSLDIRPLSTAARERYVDSWQHVQLQFVDDPAAAVCGCRHPDPVRHGRSRLPGRRLRTACRRHLGRPPARGRELPGGTSPRTVERPRRRHHRGSAAGDAPLPRPLRRARRGDRRRAPAARPRSGGRRGVPLCAGNPAAVSHLGSQRTGLWDPKNCTIGLAQASPGSFRIRNTRFQRRGDGMTPEVRIQAAADQLEARWRDDPRWMGVERTYTATTSCGCAARSAPSRRWPASARSGSGSSSSATSPCARSARSPAARPCRW